MHIQTTGDGVFSRRAFMRRMAIGAAGMGVLGWKDNVALRRR